MGCRGKNTNQRLALGPWGGWLTLVGVGVLRRRETQIKEPERRGKPFNWAQKAKKEGGWENSRGKENEKRRNSADWLQRGGKKGQNVGG